MFKFQTQIYNYHFTWDQHQIMSILTYNQLKQFLIPLEHENKAQDKKDTRKQYMLDISHHELRKVPLEIPSKQFKIVELNASYNYFKDLYQLNNQPNPDLSHLILSFNFLTSKCMESFGPNFVSLKILDLSANRIESVDIKDEDFPQIQALYLKNNKIKYFVHCPSTLKILCLDHNLLQKLGFSGGEFLQILSASANRIQVIDIQHPEKLQFLDLQENMISDMPKFEQILKKADNLLSLNAIGNYISKVGHKKFLIAVLSVCSKVVKVDEIIINPHVRQAFKVLKQEENLQRMFEETQDAYKKRMKEQIAMKEEMLDKLDAEREEIQKKFTDYFKKQKEHLDALEDYAKNNLGARKLNITNENKGMSKNVNDYLGDDRPKTSAQKKDPSQNIDIINEHQAQYQQYKQSQSSPKNSRSKSKNKYDEESINSDNQQLDAHQQERRRRNMRNPTLIYRNSNQIIINQEELAKLTNSDKKERMSNMKTTAPVVNPKCFPYLMKQYGFHTIV